MMQRPIREAIDEIAPHLGELRRRNLRAAGLRLAARAMLLSESWHRSPAERNAALASAECLLEKHGPVRDGWLEREVERQRAGIEAAEAERAQFCAPLGPDRILRSGWSLWDVAMLAQAILADCDKPLLRPELRA